MDTSETYIKMCEKSVEITSEHTLFEGDFYYWDNWRLGHPLLPNQVEIGVDYHNWSGRVILKGGRYIWLPRQDQLQEIIATHRNTNYTVRIIHEFVFWLDDTKIGYYENLSMEQLWLIFVMKEKYNKVWDGEDWIVIK